MRAFSRAAKYINKDTAIILYNSAIASRLNYCDVIWSPTGTALQNNVQVIQNTAARRVLGARDRHASQPLLSELGWVSLKDKRELHKIVLFKKILNGKGPCSLLEELETYRRTTNRVIRSNQDNIVKKSCRTEYGKRLYFNGVIGSWNQLPPTIKSTNNLKSFKEKLHEHMLHRCRRSLI